MGSHHHRRGDGRTTEAPSALEQPAAGNNAAPVPGATDPAPSATLAERTRPVYEYAWAWFSHHSTQRLTVVNCWLLAVAFLTAGLVNAVARDRYGLATLIAAGGVAATVTFRCLDNRTRFLISVAEQALLDYEAGLADALQLPTIQLVRAAHQDRRRFASYRVILAALQGTTAVAYGTALVSCLLKAVAL